MKSRLPQLRYCALQGFIWGIFGVLVGYSHVYLLSLGLSNTQVSLALAVASALSVGLTPLLTALAARWKGLTVSRVLCALAAGIALGGCCFSAFPGGRCRGRFSTGWPLFSSTWFRALPTPWAWAESAGG